MKKEDLNANQLTIAQDYSLTALSSQPQKLAKNSINSLFPTPAEENKIQQARSILKDIGKSQTDEQIQTAISEFEFLIYEWLDEYEKLMFEGKTLKDLLQINP